MKECCCCNDGDRLSDEAERTIVLLLNYMVPCSMDGNYCLTHQEHYCAADLAREQAKALLPWDQD
jgi:hypothetical protein